MNNRQKSKTSNTFFSENQAITAGLEQELKNVSNIKSFLTKYKKHMISQTLSEHLTQLLVEKEKSIADVVHDSFLDRTYVYQIFSGKRTPSRDKLISIAFGLHLSADETQKLLKISGNRKLYVKDERDAIILFSIHNNQVVGQTNFLLIDNGFTPLEGPVR